MGVLGFAARMSAVTAMAPCASTAAPVTSAVPKAKPRKAEPSARKRKFSGSTSDHMRIPEMATEAADAESASRNRREGAPRRPAHDTFFGDAPVTESAPASESAASAASAAAAEPAKAGKPAKAATAEPPKGSNLMSGKSVELGVEVPKELRKAAKAEAKTRGLDLDTVVIDLLHAWVTDPH